MVRQYSQFMALMNNYDYFKENVGVAESSTGALEKQAEIYAESWEAAEKRVRAAAEGIYKDLIDDKFFISLNNGFADIISGLDAFIEKAGGLKTVIIALSGVLLSNFSNKIPEALSKVRYNFDVLTKGSEAAYQNILKQMNQSSQQQFDEYKSSKGKRGIKEDSSMGLAIKQANELSVARAKYFNIENRLTEAEKQRYQFQLKMLETEQQDIQNQVKKNEEVKKELDLQQQNLANKKVIVNKKDISSGLDLAASTMGDLIESQQQRGQQNDGGILFPNGLSQTDPYQQAIDSAEDFYDAINRYRGKINDQYTQIHQIIMKSFSKGEFNQGAESIKVFKDLDFSKADGEIETMVNSMEKIAQSNINGAEKVKVFQNQLKALSSTIPTAVQEATGLDNVFRQLGQIKDPDKLQEAIKRLKDELSNAKIPAKNFEDVIRDFDGSNIDTLIQRFKDLGVSEEEARILAEKLSEKTRAFSPEGTLRLSEGFASAAAGMMNCYNIMQSLSSMWKSMEDPDTSGWEKLGIVLSGFTSISFGIQGLSNSVSKLTPLMKNLGEKALAKAAASTNVFSGAFKGLGAILTSSMGAVLGVIAALVALIGVIKLISWAAKKAKDASPEGQLEKITKATESAKKAAEEAATAYDDLKAAFDSYDNAINKLDDLEKGTQSFTDALEDANAQAWELIKKYNLIKGEDWKIGDNGEIIITQEGKDKSQNEAYSNKISTATTANTLSLMESQQKVKVAESKLDYLKTVVPNISYNDVIQKLLSNEEGLNLSEIKAKLDEVDLSPNQQDRTEFLKKYSNILFGREDAVSKTRSIISSAEKLQDYKDAHDQYNRDLESYGGQNVQSILNGNQAYQNSSYKNEIFDKANENYEQALEDATAKWDDINDKGEIRTAFEKALGDNYEVRNNGDVINKTTHQKDDYYSGLSDDQKKQIIAAQEASLEVDNFTTTLAKNFNDIDKNFSQSDKKAFSKLKGNLSEEDYKNLKGLNKEELLKSLGFSGGALQKIKAAFGDSFTGILDSLSDQIKNYDPTQFDLKAWQENYENQLAAAEKISDSGIIKDKYFDELSPELQGFFEDLQNGTHVLTISADEFNQKIRELSQQDLKKSIDDSIQAIQDGVQAYGESVGRQATLDEVNHSANGMLENPLSYQGTAAYDAMVKATGFTPDQLDNFSSAEERIKAVAQAWLDLTNGLENKKTAIASSVGSIQELDAALTSGEISIEAYNKAFNAVLAADAKSNGFDYSEIEDYAETLMEVNEELKDNRKLAEKIALAEKKQVKGVKDLKDNYTNYAKILKQAKNDQTVKNTEDYSKAIQSLRKDLSLLTGMEEEAFSDEIINSDEMQKALQDVANGADGAIERLKALAVIGELKVKISKDDASWNQLQNDIAAISADSTIEIGTIVNNNDALQGLYDLMMQAGMTADQIQSRFNDLGWDPQLTYKEMTVDEAAQNGSYTNKQVWVPDSDGMGWHQVTLTDTGIMGVDGSTIIRVPVIGNSGKGGFQKIDPPTKASAPSSSGGGGGGKKSHADTKSFSDKERYHTIKNQIEDLNAEYDDLNDAKDRAFGKDRLKYMDQEISKTDELIKAQREYLRQIENNLPTDKAIMEKAYNEYIGGPGIQYDEKGNISNFDTIQDAMFNKYNDMASSYTDDSDEWKVFEKKYELLEKYIKQYEETYDLLRDQRQELQDLINQKIDLGLEQVQYSVEVKLDIPEDKIKFLEYRLGRIDDDAFKSIEAVTLLTKKADEVYKKIQINKEALNDVLKLSMSVGEITQLLAGNTSVLAGKTFTEDQISALKEYRDNLLDLNSELDDIRSNIEDKVMTAFDAWKEKLDSGISTIEHYGNVLQSYRNIIDIVGKDTLGITGEFMNNLAQGTVDNAIDKLKGTKKNYETIMNARDEAAKKLAEAEAQRDEASVKMWKDTLDQINKEVESSNEEMMQAWEDALSGIAEQFENTMNDLVDKFNDSVYALGGLDALNDDFSRQQENADLMLDDYQKIYELSKLSRDINKTIDDTDIISGKQKLKKLLGQINDLQEDGNEMSKYDLEYLQKTYDLRLAEIELEEAQRAKNTVRLQKDSEGNWSYIYTQSSDAIDSAQQKYEDALYAMQDLSSNYIDEMSEKLISTSKDMEEALAAIRIQDYASIDDYYAAVKKVQDQYQEQLDTQQNELQKALDNNKQLYDEDWKNYHDATGYKISDMEDFATKFKDTMLGALLGSESDTANFNDLIKDSVYNLTLGLQQAAETYYENLEKAMQAAGTSTKDFAEDASESIEQVVQDSQKGTDAVNDMADQMKTAFGEITDSVSSWQENYSKNMEAIIESNLKVIKSFNDMLESLSINPDSITVKYDIANAAKDQDIDSYDSGGYTGNWGTVGKLAVLHQKEIVLNADDTANMLAAVQITRAMLDTIDLNAKQASLGLGNLMASGIKEEKTETLKQEVNITAEFPNVQNHTEIEDAFNNLINQASQYAYRSR